MAGLSDYLEAKLADHLFRGVLFPVPMHVYISLHTADPTDTGMIGELSGNGYQRIQVPCTYDYWTRTNGVITNSTIISFPTATQAWGSITHFGLWDSNLGGNMLLSGQLNQAKVVNQADVISFPVSFLTVTFS